ncbi:MAG: ABC transporter permease [Methylobacteriaceae bacterium]|nr:ABC transporter permease [Methylobacteriaceae bacterium]MBV9245783.1 ABC transporter permease [Methylobacteriaceae bacterium]MBV9637926.1 ABC transporter permease [Methylobacteriaceae bacterium]MBV9703589.1 ABC transporter permease [Methylobacteriaceae bacterium]
MRIDLEPRAARSPTLEVLAPVAALILAMLIGGVVIAALGRSPVEAFKVYFIAPVSDLWSLQKLAIKASPLVLIAVGLSFCYRANLWNIGAEGQYIAGALLGGWLAIATHDGAYQGLLGGWWILPAMLALGGLGGLLYAMIPALLRVSLGVSEILTSLMLVYVAQFGLDYMVRGPWRDPHGYNFPQTVSFDDPATLPLLVPGAGLHAGVLVSLAAVLIAAVVFSRTLFGYEVRLVGSAPKAARFAGFSDRRLTILVFAISGALAGLAGLAEVSGQIGKLQPEISPPPGYGFTAIIVAFLGRLNPVGILIAGVVLAMTYLGGETAQIALKLPVDMTRAFQGILLMCVLAADVFTRYRLRLSFARRA